MESLGSPGLLRLVLLTACLAPSSPSPTPPQDDLCVFDPGWQVLEEGIGRFGCQVDEEVRSLNCSDQGIPALPPSSDTAVPEDTEVFDFSNNRIRCLPKVGWKERTNSSFMSYTPSPLVLLLLLLFFSSFFFFLSLKKVNYSDF